MKRRAPLKPGKPLQRRTPLRATAPAKAEVKLHRMRRCSAKLGGCGQMFRPARKDQQACGEVCALSMIPALRKLADEARAKAERKADRARKRELEPLSKSLSRAEDAINRYVRARDYRYGCISCHLPADWDGQWHASHLRSVGAATAVRFHLWNIHKACWICNKLFSGRIDAYKPQAIERIGAAKVDWLYTQTQVVKYSREYLARLASVFNRKAARQERRNALLDLR